MIGRGATVGGTWVQRTANLKESICNWFSSLCSEPEKPTSPRAYFRRGYNILYVRRYSYARSGYGIGLVRLHNSFTFDRFRSCPALGPPLPENAFRPTIVTSKKSRPERRRAAPESKDLALFLLRGILRLASLAQDDTHPTPFRRARSASRAGRRPRRGTSLHPIPSYHNYAQLFVCLT